MNVLDALSRAIVQLESRLRVLETREDTMHGWQPATLVNSWADVGAPYAPAGHWMRSNGTIILRGRVTGGGAGSVIFTLPTDHKHRPPYTYTFGNVSVNTSGQVIGLTTGPLSLDGIQWIAEQ